jgi:hypothetical protein
MRRLVASVLVVATVLVALSQLRLPATAQPAAQQPPAERPPAPRPNPDSLAAARDSMMNAVLKSIAGREAAPAESVFKEVKALRGMPAGRFVRVMNTGFSRSLGVGCDHCHTPGEWAKEDKRPKQVARDMWAMTRNLNSEVLPKIANLQGKPPTVNCTTCHRGEVTPATNLAGR